MYCPKCHTPPKSEDRFCQVCGTKLLEEPSYTPSVSTKKKSPITIILLSVAVVIFAGFAVFAVANISNSQGIETSSNTSSTSTSAVSGVVSSNVISSSSSKNSSSNSNSQSNQMIRYSTSANTVNGGMGIYDGDSYYICDTSLKKTDKNGKTTVLLNEKAYYLTANSEYLFFKSLQDTGVYKMKKDGTGKTKIYSGNIHELTLYNNKLYFCVEEENSAYIVSMNLDGTNVTKLYDCNEWYMSIYNDKIYFTEYSSNRELKAMNLDGSNVQTLHNGSCYDLCIVDGVLYFSEGDDTRYMYKMELETQNITLVRQKYTRSTNFYDDKLYFTDASKNILCCNLDGSNEKTVCKSGNALYITLLPSKLYYYTVSGDLVETSPTK